MTEYDLSKAVRYTELDLLGPGDVIVLAGSSRLNQITLQSCPTKYVVPDSNAVRYELIDTNGRVYHCGEYSEGYRVYLLHRPHVPKNGEKYTLDNSTCVFVYADGWMIAIPEKTDRLNRSSHAHWYDPADESSSWKLVTE